MKIAVIGYGGMGAYHCSKLKKYSIEYPECKIEVIGVYDTDKKRQQVAQTDGYRAYHSAAELFEGDCNAVLIATPNDSHCNYAKQAAYHKKHIICEKPIAMNSSEVADMYNTAEKQGVQFTVHQNRRWDGDFLTVKKAIEQGVVGDVCVVESSVMGSNGIPGDWRTLKKHGGGMMLDWGVHLIDQVLQMGLGTPCRLFCDYSYFYGEEVDDGFCLHLEFESGIKAIIRVDTNSFISLPRWRICGTAGTLSLNSWADNATVVAVKDRGNVAKTPEIAGNGLTKTMAKRDTNATETLTFAALPTDLYEFYLNFYRACVQGLPLHIKRREVESVFDIMTAADLSATQQKVIKL